MNADEIQDDAIIGQAFRASLLVLAGAFSAGAVVYYAVTGDKAPPAEVATPLAPAEVRRVPPQTMPHVPFTDVTHEAGIDFVHVNGATGEKMLPETMGGGAAWLDYDADGDQDLLLVNSSAWPGRQPDTSKTGGKRPTLALYRNDGRGNFDNVTEAAGLAVSLYGMGAAVGDIDRDGFVDLFVTAVGPNRMFRNRGNGTFEEVTETAGVAGREDAWSTSSAMFDFDNDGDLDLFVCNYVRWSRDLDLDQGFQLTGVGRAYGPPVSFAGSYPYLYRNDGAGHFTDVSAAAGVEVDNRVTGQPLAKSLGVLPIDVDRDGWIDLIVANDTVQNFLFHNLGANGDNGARGQFEEIGSIAGIAFDAAGQARGAMGIDAAYYRNDESLGIAIGNFANEMTALYVAMPGASQFSDDAIATGLGPPTRRALSFGLMFLDVDLDSRLDVLTANGHLEEEITKVQASQHYRQPAQLFWNCGPGAKSEFVQMSAEQCGTPLFQPIVGRGAAYADIDGDGDLDVLLTQIAGRPLLLRNDQQLGHHFLRIRLIGTTSNWDAIGAWIVVRLGDQTLRRQVMPTRSYLSQVELPVTIGLGERDRVDTVTILWPGGGAQSVDQVKMDATTVVRQSHR